MQTAELARRAGYDALRMKRSTSATSRVVEYSGSEARKILPYDIR